MDYTQQRYKMMTQERQDTMGGENEGVSDEKITRSLSEIHFKCTSLALCQTGESKAKRHRFIHGDIKTAIGMYLVYGSANELVLTENCHKILVHSVYLACY